MTTASALSPVAIAPVSVASSTRISTIQDLEALNIAYNDPCAMPEIRIAVEKSQKIFITSKYIIFTTDATDENYNRCRAILRSAGLNAKTHLVSAAVMQHIHAGLHEAHDSDDHVSVNNRIADNGPDSKVQMFFNSMANDAVSQKATDIKIHIHGNSRESMVWFKVDGQYEPQPPFSSRSSDFYMKMIRAVVDYHIHNEGGDSSSDFNPDIPGDYQIPVEVEGFGKVKMRMGLMPAEYDSLAISIRIPSLSSEDKIQTFIELGFLPEQSALMTDMMNAPFGLNLFTGPTGSGKTTTLAAALTLRPDHSPSITLEQPVEISIKSKPALLQCPIDENDPLKDWDAMLRQTLRQNPEVIMIGEIRDEKVANALYRAAGTGHLVLSTLHANTITAIPSQLEYYKLPLHKIAENSFLRLLVASRLIQGLCKKCSIPLSEYKKTSRDSIRVAAHFKAHLDTVKVLNPEGCSDCRFTGIQGKKLIAEVAYVDQAARNFIIKEKYDEWRAHLKSQGWIDMKAHAEIRVINGELCPFVAENNVATKFGFDEDGDESFSYSNYRNLLNEESI